MVFPAIETRALPGNREDAYRAGITPRIRSGTIDGSTSSRSDPMKTLQDFTGSVAQSNGPAVRTTHGARGRRKGPQKPLNLSGFQAHVDFDRGPAGDGGGHRSLQIVQ